MSCINFILFAITAFKLIAIFKLQGFTCFLVMKLTKTSMRTWSSVFSYTVVRETEVYSLIININRKK
ncbi:MAG: hypothetical protein CMM94_08315, partial [Rickettsiales bacterium]|nr:hypothetical protein [Rickettsiales bacterium]